jgi:hypothetical protein
VKKQLPVAGAQLSAVQSGKAVDAATLHRGVALCLKDLFEHFTATKTVPPMADLVCYLFLQIGVKDWNEEQIKAYVEKWFENDCQLTTDYWPLTTGEPEAKQ